MRTMKMHLGNAVPALLALSLIGAWSQADAMPRHCVLLGMLGGALPAECTEQAESGNENAGPAANTTRPAFVSISGVNNFSDGTMIADAASTLTRSQQGVSFQSSARMGRSVRCWTKGFSRKH